ncbi:MAG TPA: amidohydrolase family protein [SAR202 cluster bacterium]|nr:amidohydrolase family protein [SAR202 cluster bacterium]
MASIELVDAHLHIHRSREEGRSQFESGYVIWEYGEKPDVRFSEYDGGLEDALDAIEKAGFSKAVVTNLFSLPASVDANDDVRPADLLVEFNNWACELVRPYDQLVPFIAADPTAMPGEAGAKHVREMVEKHGARGIKLHPVVQRFEMTDPRMWPVYDACQELGIPILVHSGPARGGEPYAEPRCFADVLAAFPNLTIVLAHLGGATWDQALEIARAYPNACFDCCEIIEWTGAPNAPTDAQLARLIANIGPERVMMGSDFPWYDLDRQVERIMELPILSREQKEAMMGANAIRILGL